MVKIHELNHGFSRSISVSKFDEITRQKDILNYVDKITSHNYFDEFDHFCILLLKPQKECKKWNYYGIIALKFLRENSDLLGRHLHHHYSIKFLLINSRSQ